MPEVLPEATLAVIFTTSFVVALSGSLMPGPVLALTISGVAQRGFWAGPLIIIGHGILELALILALIFGLSRFMQSDLVASIIGIVGGVALMGIGFTTVLKGRNSAMPLSDTGGYMMRNHMLVASGIITSISNPYWFLWWATVGLAYLLWSLELGIAGVASFYSGHFLADFGWYALIAFVLSSGRKIISDRLYRWMLIVCGFALVGLGVYFIASGVGFLA